MVRLAMLAIADALDDAEAYLADYRDHQPAALQLLLRPWRCSM